MDNLRLYVAGLPPKEKYLFAEKCGTTLNYLRKVMSTGQKIGPEICAQIEIHSDGIVTRKSLRPFDWVKIWPELAAPAQEASQ